MLAREHKLAYKAWNWCSKYGRDTKQRLKVESVIETIKAMGGSIGDTEKVIEIIEPYFLELNG